jgi:hypothetical protein
MSTESSDSVLPTEDTPPVVGRLEGEMSSVERTSIPSVKKRGGKHKNKSTLTYEDYLKYAYQRNGQRLTIADADYLSVVKSIREDIDYRALLSEQVDSDINLNVPFEIVMLADSKKEFPLFQRALLDFVAKVMKSNSVYQSQTVLAALSRDASTTAIADAVNDVIRNPIALSPVTSDPACKETLDRKLFYGNAAKLIIAWHAVARDLSLDELASVMTETLWNEALRETQKGSSTLRRRMIETDDSWVCGWVSRSANQRVADARKAKSNALSHASTLSEKVGVLQESVIGLEMEVARLDGENADLAANLKRMQIESEDRERQSRVMLGYEIQTLKGECIDILESATSKLANGVAAATRSPDLSAVLLERSEIVLEALTRYLTELKTENRDVTP